MGRLQMMQIAACGSPRYCIAIRYEHIQSSLIANQAAVCTITATALTAGSQVNCSSTLSAVRLFAKLPTSVRQRTTSKTAVIV